MRRFTLLTLTLAACTQAPPVAVINSKISDDLYARIAGGAAVDLIVQMREPKDWETFDDVKAQVDTRMSVSAQSLYEYSHLPMRSVRIKSVEALDQYINSPDVLRIEENGSYTTSLTHSLPLIGQPVAAAQGFVGLGTTVAVIDQAVDYTNPAFGCIAPGEPGCPIAYYGTFGDGTFTDPSGHGTNVAGIVHGVAPGARIAALAVSQTPNIMWNAAISALNWAIAHKEEYNIVSVNMSFGDSFEHATDCEHDIFTNPMQHLRNAGIIPVAASGNSAFSHGIASPACTPAAVAVGAVYSAGWGEIGFPYCSDASSQADQITCFSNSSSKVALLAPGARITAANISMDGTSQATPHVAGAIAVLRSAFPSETMSQTLLRLTTTGVRIQDAHNGLSFPRISLSGAVAYDGIVHGAFSINYGSPTVAQSSVVLDIAVPNGVNQVCVSNSDTCYGWTGLTSQMLWNLTPGTGTKTVSMWFKDYLGNTSEISRQSIEVVPST